MDEQLSQMRRFLLELERFDVMLTTSFQEVRVRHDDLNSLWQDEFRREYDAQYSQFAENMERYCYREAVRYEGFLREKIRTLSLYLRGS